MTDSLQNTAIVESQRPRCSVD